MVDMTPISSLFVERCLLEDHLYRCIEASLEEELTGFDQTAQLAKAVTMVPMFVVYIRTSTHLQFHDSHIECETTLGPSERVAMKHERLP